MEPSVRRDAHPDWLRTVQVVSITQVAILVGFGLAFPFLPLFIQELGVTDRSELALWTGLAIGSGGITMALLSPVWGLVGDRIGQKTMLVRSIAGGSIVLALQAAATSVWQLIAVRILQGGLTGTQTAGAMLIAGIVPRERTGFALGLLNTSVQVGNLLGPVLGGFVVVAFGLRGSFLIGGLILAVCAVLTIAFVHDSERPLAAVSAPELERARAAASTPDGRERFRETLLEIVRPFAWPTLRGVLIVGIVVQVVSSSTVAMIAIYALDLSRPAWLGVELIVGLALALSALAAAVLMPVLGSWADRHDARVLLVASLVVGGVALVPQALVPNALVFLAFRLLTGAGLAGTISAIGVLTRAGAPSGAEGRAFGTLAAAQNMGWGIGPLLGSAIAASAGIPALYLVAALALLALLVPLASSRTWLVPMSHEAATATPGD